MRGDEIFICVLSKKFADSKKVCNFALPFTKHRARSSVGRALEWHSRGQGFDSPRVHQARNIENLVGS